MNMTTFLLQKDIAKDPYFQMNGAPVFGSVLIEFMNPESGEYDSLVMIIKQPLQDAGKDHLRRAWQKICHDENLGDPDILGITLESTAEKPKAELLF